jgi:hypothetical protein
LIDKFHAGKLTLLNEAIILYPMTLPYYILSSIRIPVYHVPNLHKHQEIYHPFQEDNHKEYNH